MNDLTFVSLLMSWVVGCVLAACGLFGMWASLSRENDGFLGWFGVLAIGLLAMRLTERKVRRLTSVDE